MAAGLVIWSIAALKTFYLNLDLTISSNLLVVAVELIVIEFKLPNT